MPWLVALNGELAGKWFPLDAPCLVGRGPLNHVVLDDPRISRQHAKISPEEGGHVVYDLNSANGTFVDEQPVKRRKLEAGEVVRFGPFTFRFEVGSRRPASQHPYGSPREVRTLMGMERAHDIVGSVEVTGEVEAGLSVLEDSHRKLSTLYDFMKSIATTLKTDELAGRIVTNLLDVFPQADVVTIYGHDEATGTLSPLTSMRRGGDAAAAPALSPQVYDEVVRRGRAILSAVMLRRPRPTPTGHSVHAPLLYRDTVQGVLHLGADDEDAGFVQSDLDLAAGLAAVAAMALQNARMHAESLRQQRHQQDLRLAQQLQKSFLPRRLPEVAGLEFHAEYLPTHSVGGDFYDLFRLDERRVALVLGDVAGKGVSAALLMARISSDLRVAALAEAGPAQVLARLNRELLEREQHEVFVTCIYATIDVETLQVRLANAGHLPPLLHRDGVATPIEGSATAIGFFPDTVYDEVELALAPGDALILVTDGAAEATSADGEQLGMARLAAALGAASGARALAGRLLDSVRRHVGTAPQYDDLTLLVVSRS